MIEILIITALILWSVLVVFKKLLPQTSNSVFSKLSNMCETHGWTMLAKFLKPKMASGCGGHCSCPSSENDVAKKTESQAVKWK